MHFFAVFQDCIFQDVAFQIECLIVLLQGEHSVFHLYELDVLVYAAYFVELACPGAVCGNDAVVDKIALCRTAVVYAVAVFVESVEFVLAVLDVLGVYDGLVYPVPDAASHAIAACFHNVPVLLEIAYGVSHGVGVFTHEVGLVFVVDVSLDGWYVAIHDAEYV